MKAYRGGQAVIWSGPPGAGKTRAAEWLTSDIEKAFALAEDSPLAFRAVHYEAGPEKKTRKGSGAEALRDLYLAVNGFVMDPGQTHGKPLGHMVRKVCLAIAERRVGIVLVDEAQRLDRNGIDALVSVLNAMTKPGSAQRTTFVLIGTEGFREIQLDGKFDRRFSEHIRFDEVELEDCQAFLKAVEPAFREWDPDVFEDTSRYIHEITRGLPGHVLPWLRRARSIAEELGKDLIPGVLRAAHDINEKARAATISDQAR